MSDNYTALTIPGCTQLPLNTYIQGPEYKVTFDRITIPKIVPKLPFPEPEDEYEETINALSQIGKPPAVDLDAYNIRQILANNAIKDFIDEEDSRFIQTVNACMKIK